MFEAQGVKDVDGNPISVHAHVQNQALMRAYRLASMGDHRMLNAAGFSFN